MTGRRIRNPARDAWRHPDDVIAALELDRDDRRRRRGGSGYFTVRLARAVPDGEIIATDIEPDMVRYLAERAQREGLANIRAIRAGADDPNLAPASVDRPRRRVWHHLGDRLRYARGLAAALRPGGRLAIVDFTAEATHGPPPAHRLAPAAIIADLRQAAGSTRAFCQRRCPSNTSSSGCGDERRRSASSS